jgi:hypothetical protein
MIKENKKEKCTDCQSTDIYKYINCTDLTLKKTDKKPICQLCYWDLIKD